MDIVVRFAKSTSQYLHRALTLAKRWQSFETHVDDGRESYTVRCSFGSARDVTSFIDLFNLVSKWRGTEITYEDGKPYGYHWQILECCKQALSASNTERYCDGVAGNYGPGEAKFRHFGCRFISLDERYGDSTQWYDFGSFSSENVWVIDKPDIKRVARVMLEDRGADRCPLLNLERVDILVDALPDIIDLRTDLDFVGRQAGDMISGVDRKEKSGASLSFSVGIRPPDELNKVEEVDSLVEIPGEAGPRYEDIGGLDAELEEIRMVAELPLKYPDLVRHLGVKVPKGILLFGPPGCGKTLIARALATECKAGIFVVKGPELLSKWWGESEANLRKLFAEASKKAPSIIFFDELDATAYGRAKATQAFESSFVGQLLTLMDGFDPLRNVVMIGTTNMPDLIDPALLRPGRFDRLIRIGPPDEGGRLTIFQIHTKQMPVGPAVRLDELARMTPGYTGADIESVCAEAAMQCARRTFGRNISGWPEHITDIMADQCVIRTTDFLDALLKVPPTPWQETPWERSVSVSTRTEY